MDNQVQGTLLEVKPTETKELIAALCKAQATFKPALKDADNPYFKSKYADLNAIWEACKEGLAGNGLFVSQQPYTTLEGKTMLKTRVYHESGGYLESELLVIVQKQNDPQSFGSALTYARRYALAAILGIVTDDDDAEGAMSRDQPKQQQKAAQQPVKQQEPQPQKRPMTAEQRSRILDLLKNPAQSEETVKRVTAELDSYDYDQAMKEGIALKKIVADKAMTNAAA